MILRPDLPPLPDRMKSLPLDHRGFPVPWFVAWINGEPDFRVIDTPKMAIAVKQHRCWVCGAPKGRWHAFVIGPMCAVNRTISEPPSHLECAGFSAKACPFLTRPKMRRNEHQMPEERHEAAGLGLKRNPGVVCLWITRDYKPFKVGNGVLFEIGEPSKVLWFCEGREATRAEVEDSINSGMPSLRELAEAEGPPAIAALERYMERVRPLLPRAA